MIISIERTVGGSLSETIVEKKCIIGEKVEIIHIDGYRRALIGQDISDILNHREGAVGEHIIIRIEMGIENTDDLETTDSDIIGDEISVDLIAEFKSELTCGYLRDNYLEFIIGRIELRDYPLAEIATYERLQLLSINASEI